MIIGINGFAGSGKDTVGSIIQYILSIVNETLLNHQKDFKDFVKASSSNVLTSGWEIKKFADPLKQVASILTGIPKHYFEDQEFKKTYMDEQWNFWKLSWNTWYGNNLEDEDTMEMYELFNTEQEALEFKHNHELSTASLHYIQPTVREFLQWLGTDAIRKHIHPNAWINAVMSDYKAPKMDQYNPSRWVFTDMRFPNEVQKVQEYGITIKVIRPGVEPTNAHISEVALKDWKFDYIINNDADIDTLINKVKIILKELKIIQ